MKKINNIELDNKNFRAMDLPIIIQWYQYNLDAHDILEKAPQKIKFTYIDKIVNVNINVIGKFIEAKYTTENKINLLRDSLIEIEKLRFSYRFLFDKKFISIRQYEKILEQLISVSKMTNGWIKSCNR